MGGFKKFLLRGNLVDLAVAFVIGAAFAALVSGLVKDLITPLIAAIGGKPDFAALTFTINNSKFLYGDFLNLLISFVILAAVVYFLVVVPFSRLLERFKPTPDQPAPVQDCPHCLSSIPQAATVCAFCTRDVGTAIVGAGLIPRPPSCLPSRRSSGGSRWSLVLKSACAYFSRENVPPEQYSGSSTSSPPPGSPSR